MKKETKLLLLSALLAAGIIGVLNIKGTDRKHSSDVYDSCNKRGQTDLKDSSYPLPYKTIALQAASVGCYISCDIGVMDEHGIYRNMDTPTLSADSKEIREFEVFELVPCSDGSYALRSAVNRQFISYIGMALWGTLKCDADFVKRGEELILIPEKSGVIKFKNYNKWLCVKDGKLCVTDDRDKAEVFNQILIDDNQYTEEELKVLSSDEWFNIDRSGLGGLYDIQYDVGQNKYNNAVTLKNLGYTIMNKGDQLWERDYVEIDKMQCFVAYKERGGGFDVIIAFHGTNGYGLDDQWSDILSNLTGFKYTDTEHMHKGYHQMAKKLINNEDKIVNQANTLTLQDLISKAIEGKAKFTILGFSMGGAIAQCYALHLAEIGIPKDQIRGRTFNSTLACSFDDDEFTDWYNLCVSTDSVCNGLIPGSLLHYGVHRIGKTIWLYDDEPEINKPKAFSNISINKHYLNKCLFKILNEF